MNMSTFHRTMQSTFARSPRGNGSGRPPISSSENFANLPPALHGYLVRWAKRCRTLAVLNAIGWALALALIWMLMSCGADRLLHLPTAWRILLLACGAILPALLLLSALMPLRKPIDWVAVAQSIERANPHFGQRLITVTSRVLGAQAYRGSEQILHALIDSVEDDARAPARKLPSLRSIRAAWSACLVTICVGLFLVLTPELDLGALAHRYLNPI